MLLTLQRRGELALAEWREFDFKEKTWTIPDEHAKGGKGHVVPLSDWATRTQTLKLMYDGSRYVLPNSDRSAPANPLCITRGVARCLKRFKQYGVAPFTPHDLRRTGRTGLARLGINKDIAERILNHVPDGMVGVYDVHDYATEKHAALEQWASHLKTLT